MEKIISRSRFYVQFKEDGKVNTIFGERSPLTGIYEILVDKGTKYLVVRGKTCSVWTGKTEKVLVPGSVYYYWKNGETTDPVTVTDLTVKVSELKAEL